MSPPSAFGTYRVLHQIGSGVLGPVFRAYDSQLDRLVAIKTIKLDLVPEDAARLADRLRALAAERPAHPAIVGGVDAGLAGSTPFIALDYASGESLDVLLRQSGAWPIARALLMLREIAVAIDASWAHEVGHGALHPRDIFIGLGPADVHVTGFGIGQALEGVGAKAPVRRPYSAAERGDGEPWDIRADVYSLGVVACEMLSGQRPVGPDDDGEALAVGLAQSEPELSPDARAAVRRVLAVAMADLPDDRYETAAGFVDALAGAARPAGVAVESAPVAVEPITVATEPAAVAAEPAPVAGEPVAVAVAPVAADVEPAVESPAAPKRASRIKRPRPIALDLPLLDGVAGGDRADDRAGEPAREVESVSVPEVASEPAPVVSAGPESAPAPPPQPVSEPEPEPALEALLQSEPLPHAQPEPDPKRLTEPEPEPAPSAPVANAEPEPDVTATPPLRLRDLPGDPDAPSRPSPRIDFGGSILRDDPVDVEAPVAAFPWLAVLAVFAAGLVLGGVVMYQLGWRRGSAAERAVVTAAAPAATPTAASAPAIEPPPAATPEPPAAKSATPRPSPAPDAPAAGRLVIQSVPSGALVTIDGRRAGETPVTVSVPLGRHDVQVARPGYVPRVERVELTKKSTSRTVTVQLRRGAGTAPEASATGSVDVNSRPPGARVTVDGRFIGTTPLRVPELTAGDHQVQIELAGHKTVTSTVNVVGGEVTRVSVTLERGGLALARARGVNR